MQYTGILSDEEFVGNTNANGDLSYLRGVQYRLGDIALDIYGKKLDPNYMRPLFVKKNSFGLYNTIMERQVSDIRAGKRKESPVLCEESPAQNTVEICHTAPNSAMLQGLKPHAGGTGTSA
jgi:hypothetical protein